MVRGKGEDQVNPKPGEFRLSYRHRHDYMLIDLSQLANTEIARITTTTFYSILRHHPLTPLSPGLSCKVQSYDNNFMVKTKIMIKVETMYESYNKNIRSRSSIAITIL